MSSGEEIMIMTIHTMMYEFGSDFYFY